MGLMGSEKQVFFRCAYFLTTYIPHIPTDSVTYVGLIWLQLSFTLLLYRFYHNINRHLVSTKCVHKLQKHVI